MNKLMKLETLWQNFFWLVWKVNLNSVSVSEDNVDYGRNMRKRQKRMDEHAKLVKRKSKQMKKKVTEYLNKIDLFKLVDEQCVFAFAPS